MFQSPEDLFLIGAKFLHGEIPQDKFWLTRYFDDKDWLKYLAYHFIYFNLLTKRMSIEDYFYLFLDHSGIYKELKEIHKVCRKIIFLEKKLESAEKNKDLVLINDIRLGKIRFR